MSPDLEGILRLQSLDTRSAELEGEIASLPKHIARIERQLDSHKRRLEIDRAALAANQKERKQLEGDIQVQQQKISKLKDQMLSAKTNEQYRAFQHEIEFCEKEIRRFEDRILDLMGESEPLEVNVKKAEGALAEEAKQVEAEKKSARERTAADQKALDEIRAERAGLIGKVNAQKYAAYERLRKKQSNGQAIAEAVNGQCTACFMMLRPQVMQELRQGLETLLFCENCRRILYYSPPVAVDENA
jgi:hypothetical protein